ncbi:MAG: LytR/AlgR family response regulator transcription factor [Eubacteriaceae bacterium]
MISIALCDDNELFLQYLNKLIINYDADNFKVHTYKNPNKLIFDVCESDQNFDLVFLDIEMPSINGIDLAIDIKTKLKDLSIIFISAYDRALDAYKINAFDYICKPIREKLLYESLDRFLIEYRKNKQYKEKSLYYTLKNNCDYFKINYKDILYFEKDKNKVILYYEQNNKMQITHFYKSLNQVEKELLMDNFIRCHSGFIVNKNVIYHLKNRKIYLERYNTEIEVSRKKIDEVREIIKKTILG